MSGLAARHSDDAFWVAPIRWQRIQTRRKPACDDCLLTVHDHREDDRHWPLKRAVWRRRAGESITVVCLDHRGEWLATEIARSSGRRPDTWRRWNT